MFLDFHSQFFAKSYYIMCKCFIKNEKSPYVFTNVYYITKNMKSKVYRIETTHFIIRNYHPKY